MSEEIYHPAIWAIDTIRRSLKGDAAARVKTRLAEQAPDEPTRADARAIADKWGDALKK